MAPPCPVCGANGPEKPVARLQHTLYRCPHCTLLYSERVGDPDLIARYYREGGEEYFNLPYFDTHEQIEDHPEYRNYVKALRRLQRADGSPQTLLDVGCGTGALMNVAHDLGFQPEGLEVSETVTAGSDFRVHRYDGNTAHLPNMGPYDVIVLWDVLEHVASPVETLAAFKRFLRPGGRLLLRTVNEDCLLSSWSMAFLRWGFSAPARRMHELYHVVYFTKETLSLCLERAGVHSLQYWLGEFPVERASRNPLVRMALRGAYVLQSIAGRPFEQYVVASPQETSQNWRSALPGRSIQET